MTWVRGLLDDRPESAILPAVARVNYREAASLFGHIDGTISECSFSMPGVEGSLTIKVYPWWDHPIYKQARAERKRWRWELPDGAARNIKVYPMGLREFHVTYSGDATDWDCTQEHPQLWRYERSGQLIVNGSMTVETGLEIMAAVRPQLPVYGRQANLLKYLEIQNIWRFGTSGSFSLGNFPYPLYGPVRAELDRREIPNFATYVPEPVDLPVYMYVGDSHMIADDFEIEVPEFIHEPEWCVIEP